MSKTVIFQKLEENILRKRFLERKWINNKYIRGLLLEYKKIDTIDFDY